MVICASLIFSTVLLQDNVIERLILGVTDAAIDQVKATDLPNILTVINRDMGNFKDLFYRLRDLNDAVNHCRDMLPEEIDMAG